MSKKPPKRGRPPLKAEDRRRHIVSVRLRNELREQLEASAQGNGRSLSHEAESLLERTFEKREALREALEHGYGRHIAALAVAIAELAWQTASITRVVSELYPKVKGKAPKRIDFNECLADPWTYSEIESAISHLLHVMKPEGDHQPSEAARDALIRSGVFVPGLMSVTPLLEAMRAGENERLKWVGENLGPLAKKEAE